MTEKMQLPDTYFQTRLKNKRATTIGTSEPRGKGLLYYMDYHYTTVASFWYEDGKCSAVALDTGGYGFSPTTRARINMALEMARVKVSVWTHRGNLFLYRHGHSTMPWDGKRIVFDPRERRDVEGLRLWRVGYYRPSMHPLAGTATNGRKIPAMVYESHYVEARNAICAMIIARGELPPDTKIRGAYNP